MLKDLAIWDDTLAKTPYAENTRRSPVSRQLMMPPRCPLHVSTHMKMIYDKLTGNSKKMYRNAKLCDTDASCGGRVRFKDEGIRKAKSATKTTHYRLNIMIPIYRSLLVCLHELV